MGDSLVAADDRLTQYLAKHHLGATRALGHGNDGQVVLSTNATAIKVFYSSETFERERNCLLRLLDRSVTAVAGFDVPELVNYD